MTQNKHVRVLTFHTRLGKVSHGASSCRSRFLLLLPASVSRVVTSRKRLRFLISLERRGGWPVCSLFPIPQTRKKLLWSIRSVNLTRQVQEVPRRVELRRFNPYARTLAPTGILLITSVGGNTIRIGSSTLVQCAGHSSFFRWILAEITAFQYALVSQ